MKVIDEKETQKQIKTKQKKDRIRGTGAIAKGWER